LVSIDPEVSLLNPALNVCTAHSARPLVAGWYGEAVMCRMPLFCQNFFISLLTKTVVLSVTTELGML